MKIIKICRIKTSFNCFLGQNQLDGDLIYIGKKKEKPCPYPVKDHASRVLWLYIYMAPGIQLN